MNKNIKDFRYGWRFTDEKYALFSDEELSEMSIISKDEASKIWNTICDNRILQKSKYIKKLVEHQLEVLISDCGWNDEDGELKTKSILENELNVQDTITVLYNYESALEIQKKLFLEKWSDFCYPDDVLFIVSGNIVLLYNEDTIYKCD